MFFREALFRTLVSIIRILRDDLAQAYLHLCFALFTLMKPKIKFYLSIGRHHRQLLNATKDQFRAVQEKSWLRMFLGFWRSCREAFLIWGDSESIFYSELRPLLTANPILHRCPAHHQFTRVEQ